MCISFCTRVKLQCAFEPLDNTMQCLEHPAQGHDLFVSLQTMSKPSQAKQHNQATQTNARLKLARALLKEATPTRFDQTCLALASAGGTRRRHGAASRSPALDALLLSCCLLASSHRQRQRQQPLAHTHGHAHSLTLARLLAHARSLRLRLLVQLRRHCLSLECWSCAHRCGAVSGAEH